MSKRKIMIPVAILALSAVAFQLIVNNPPQVRRGGPPRTAQMSVEAVEIKPTQYQVMIDSFGTVKPRTESALVAQVAGQINFVSDAFRDGGFFEKGDVLVTIDDRDYRAEMKIAESSLINAKQSLLEEQARVEQALVDWKRLGNGKEPSDLVLRKPQLESAKAQVLSAQAQLDKAQLKLERTQIVAPYAGRILKKKVDLGQVISNNSQLADIYAVDYVEIRLPIKNNDLALVNLPEEYRNSENGSNKVPVLFQSDLIGRQQWQGEVVRTEGAIDDNAQQLHIVAQIANPYQNSGAAPVKIGQYVTAQIQGKTIDDAMVIPNSAIYQGSYVYIVKDGVLLRKEIITRWQNSKDALIERGLEFGDKLVLTSLGQVSSGTPVHVLGEQGAGGQAIASGKGQGKKGERRKRRQQQDGSQANKGNNNTGGDRL